MKNGAIRPLGVAALWAPLTSSRWLLDRLSQCLNDRIQRCFTVEQHWNLWAGNSVATHVWDWEESAVRKKKQEQVNVGSTVTAGARVCENKVGEAFAIFNLCSSQIRSEAAARTMVKCSFGNTLLMTSLPNF